MTDSLAPLLLTLIVLGVVLILIVTIIALQIDKAIEALKRRPDDRDRADWWRN